MEYFQYIWNQSKPDQSYFEIVFHFFFPELSNLSWNFSLDGSFIPSYHLSPTNTKIGLAVHQDQQTSLTGKVQIELENIPLSCCMAISPGGGKKHGILFIPINQNELFQMRNNWWSSCYQLFKLSKIKKQTQQGFRNTHQHCRHNNRILKPVEVCFHYKHRIQRKKIRGRRERE